MSQNGRNRRISADDSGMRRRAEDFILATTCRVSVVVLFALVTHGANGHTLLIVYLKQRDVT